MSKVLLAFEDVGMAVQLQEELEAAGHEVRWDAAQKNGPADGPLWADVVLITAGANDAELTESARAWHDADPPPALLLMGTRPDDRDAANRVRIPHVPSSSTTAAISDAIASAIKLRFAGGLTSSAPVKVGLQALGLPTTGEPSEAAARLVAGARKADVEMVRQALRWHAAEYITASPDWIARLREQRVLTIPEVEFTPLLDGTRCLQTVLRDGTKLEPWQAARFVWALASVGAVKFTEEPPDQSTSRRRRITQTRFHLRRRRTRLEQCTYYDVLEVSPSADPRRVEHAVQRLALRYSPDRLNQMDLATVTPLVAPNWEQIREAHAVLTSPADRGRYNTWLQGKQIDSEWASAHSNEHGAAQMMARGQKALVAGDLFKAVADMAAACRLHPGHPDYECSLAWARFRAEASREKEPRAELARRERAIADDALAGRRPWPRALLALGLLCVADEDPESARWHLHEALACDPNLPAAKQLLARIGGGRAPTT